MEIDTNRSLSSSWTIPALKYPPQTVSVVMILNIETHERYMENSPYSACVIILENTGRVMNDMPLRSTVDTILQREAFTGDPSEWYLLIRLFNDVSLSLILRI